MRCRSALAFGFVSLLFVDSVLSKRLLWCGRICVKSDITEYVINTPTSMITTCVRMHYLYKIIDLNIQRNQSWRIIWDEYKFVYKDIPIGDSLLIKHVHVSVFSKCIHSVGIEFRTPPLHSINQGDQAHNERHRVVELLLFTPWASLWIPPIFYISPRHG